MATDDSSWLFPCIQATLMPVVMETSKPRDCLHGNGASVAMRYNINARVGDMAT